MQIVTHRASYKPGDTVRGLVLIAAQTSFQKPCLMLKARGEESVTMFTTFVGKVTKDEGENMHDECTEYRNLAK